MWLEASRKQHIVKYGPSDHVIAWSIDVKALGESSDDADPEEFLVGRALADELRLLEITECGEDVWNVADAGSAGLEFAVASLVDASGGVTASNIERPIDTVVYLYRFALHPDFSSCRLSLLDAVCRIFGVDAIILAQRHTTWFADTEFDLLGFDSLPPINILSPFGSPDIDEDRRFMLRQNAVPGDFR